jgi:hypothetical protein
VTAFDRDVWVSARYAKAWADRFARAPASQNLQAHQDAADGARVVRQHQVVRGAAKTDQVADTPVGRIGKGLFALSATMPEGLAWHPGE